MKTVIIKKQVPGFKCGAKIRLSPHCTEAEARAIRAHTEEQARFMVYTVTGIMLPRTKWRPK